MMVGGMVVGDAIDWNALVPFLQGDSQLPTCNMRPKTCVNTAAKGSVIVIDTIENHLTPIGNEIRCPVCTNPVDDDHIALAQRASTEIDILLDNTPAVGVWIKAQEFFYSRRNKLGRANDRFAVLRMAGKMLKNIPECATGCFHSSVYEQDTNPEKFLIG